MRYVIGLQFFYKYQNELNKLKNCNRNPVRKVSIRFILKKNVTDTSV